MADRPHVGLIGCGAWGRLILRDLKKLGAQVTCVAAGERSKANARLFGADAIVETLEELPSVQGAVIATPSDSHGEVLMQLAGRGIPLFVEKPLTSDLAAARRLAAIGGGLIFVMDKWRYHAGIDRIAGFAASGELGRVLGLRLFRLGWSMTHNEVDPIWNLLPHDLSICLHVLGGVPPLRLALPDGLGPPSGGVIAMLGEPGGPTATIETSAHHPVNQRSVILACEDGTVMLAGSMDDHLLLRRGRPGAGGAAEERIANRNDMPLERELAAFLRHLVGGPPPMSSAAEGLAVVERITEIRRAVGLAA